MDPAQPAQKDPAGLETLELFSNAPSFNRWLFESIVPYCQGSILEIGSGIGNISRYLLQQPGPVFLSDLRVEYCDTLRGLFGNSSNLGAVFQLDLSLPDFEDKYAQWMHQFDTVVALNVIEHIRADGLAVTNCKKLLKKNGHLIVLVPAYNWLFNSLDLELGHFKRYQKKSLKKLLESQGMEVSRSRYFNAAAIPGWWFSGSVLKKKIVPYHQLRIYNKLVPLFRMIDRLLMQNTGLSVIAVAKPS
jgi:SAM-dependent methyltransferase